MNKEIEELLNKAKDIAKYGADGKQHTRMFNQFEAKALLSYIEQLEKEYKELKDRNEINIDRNIEAYRIVEQLENNRDKAIEFIEKYRTHEKIGNNDYLKDRDDFGDLDRWQVFELIDILKGDSDEK